MSSKKNKPGCIFGISVAVIVGVGIVILFAAPLILRGIGAILVTADPLEKANAAVILSGGDDTRIDEAARLFKEDWIDYVILTETGVDVPEWNTDYTEIMRLEAIHKGIPSTAILISEQTVASTEDEARATLKLMNKRGFTSLIVITDPYHTFRTRLIFRKVFSQEDKKVIVHPVQDHWYTSRSWWLHLEGWKFTFLEYVKLFAFLLGID